MHQVTTSPESVRAVSIAEAATIIPRAERILVFGCSGTGKSTLAQALARQFGLTYVSMDRDIFWLPGWKLRPREESVQRIRDAVAGERWIMDGNNPSTLPDPSGARRYGALAPPGAQRFRAQRARALVEISRSDPAGHGTGMP